MRRAALAVLACCLALGGCHKHRPFLLKNAPAPLPARELSGGAPSFVGRWAASAARCSTAAWVLDTAAFRSPDGLSCKIDKLDPTSAGFTAYVVCAKGATSKPGRIVMTMVGTPPAPAMTLSDGPFSEPLALTRCPART